MNDPGTDFSIVAVETFVQATRDSGYKGTTSAIAELVDNSLQAGATQIAVSLQTSNDADYPIVVTTADNGSGMDAVTLRTALRFGGSSRFNDRAGLGRYGMGLPNSSLSQAKRVTVHTWQSSTGRVLASYLDLDEIALGQLREVPEPVRVRRPDFINGCSSGTAVTWTRCDRLDNRRISTIVRKLKTSLGRRFRHFLWDGRSIIVNGDPVEPIDPLYVHPRTLYKGAAEFAGEMAYEIAADPDSSGPTGIVRVRFSELPIEWAKLSKAEKRLRGITKGAGVSVVRGGREVDYGWFFLGRKRRENYDDWWRCEVQFDPVLDEAFGITHTKQQIRPRPHLLEALSPDIEAMARALNSRVRKAHLRLKFEQRLSSSEDTASRVDHMLRPLPEPSERDTHVLRALGNKLSQRALTEHAGNTEYRIVPAILSESVFFNYARDHGRLVLVLNPEHPFFSHTYRPLLESENPQDQLLRSQIDLLLLAACRAEALLEGQDVKVGAHFRDLWSDTLATFLTTGG